MQDVSARGSWYLQGLLATLISVSAQTPAPAPASTPVTRRVDYNWTSGRFCPTLLPLPRPR